MSDLLKDIFGNKGCNKGVEIFGKWSGRGKYYGRCPCDKEKCPSGYFNSFKNIYDERNPMDQSVMKSGYFQRTCGEIAGKYPHESSWNQDVFSKCKNFQQLHQGVNTELQQLKPLSELTKDYAEPYTEPFSPSEETYTRAKSFNSLLGQKVKGDSSFLNRQTRSAKEIQRANDNWSTIVGQFTEENNRIDQNIQLKTRLSEINNEAARRKNSTIMNILGASAAFFIFVFAIIGYQAGRISIRTMVTLFIVAMVVFFILAIRLNTYAMREFRKISDKLEKEIVHKGNELNIQALEWIDDNCDCGEKFAKKNDWQKQKAQQVRAAHDKMMDREDSTYYDDGKNQYKIDPAAFAKETGYLPCDLHDGDNLEEMRGAKHKFRQVANDFMN